MKKIIVSYILGCVTGFGIVFGLAVWAGTDAKDRMQRSAYGSEA